jgi:excisionase family DNA binding protein
MPAQAGAGDTVPLPARLAPLAALLVKYGAKEIAQRGGARSAMRDLPELEAILAAAAASARGTPQRTMELRAPDTEMTTAQAAAVMGVSERRVREHARTGRVNSRKAGRDWLISADSARSYRRTA